MVVGGSHEHKHKHTVLFMRFVVACHVFFVDSFKKLPDALEPLCARACGGKVGAGTVEAEEDACMGGWVD